MAEADQGGVSADRGAGADNPPITKTVLVTRLPARTRGATVIELMEATRWQAHTVRAHLTRIRKIGKVIERVERKSGPKAYRLFRASMAVEMLTSPDIESATIDG